jgi:hypothetical protein
MIKVIQRLDFENVYPEEVPADLIEYLKKVSGETLFKMIGFCSTNPNTNFDNFFSNPDISKEIYERVVEYSRKNEIEDKPEVISTYASLKLAEHILANKEVLKDNKLTSVDDDELNIFKAFLLINSELNGRERLDNLDGNNFEKLVDLNLIFLFPPSDLAISEDNNYDFLKLVYSTIYKVETLFAFLNSSPDFSDLKNEFIDSFNVVDEKEFLYQMKYLFGQLLQSKVSNNYSFEITDDSSLAFLTSMTSEDIKIDEDFTHIKNSPIYFLNKKVFSIVNYFFVVDKFYKSTKFKLKGIYETLDPLVAKYGDFFGFFNKHFSENFLMKNVLDSIYQKKYYIKKVEGNHELDGEPDYYVRHNNTIYLFENKDVLIAKSIKSSSDIEQINDYLKTRFFTDGTKAVGIGQLINSIEEIFIKEFRFDDFVNSKDTFEIFPILIIQDRIFQTPGINYRLNKWFIEELNKRLGNYNLNRVRALTIIDIDTLITWQPYLAQKDKHFKEILVDHLHRMQTHKKVDTPNMKEGMIRVNKNLTEQVRPISSRVIPFTIDKSELLNKFKDVIKE